MSHPTMPGPLRARILCVDDDDRVLSALQRQLRSRYDVTVACGGAAGLDRLRDDPPFAVVISDLHMPQMDGLTFLAAAHGISPNTVALLMSGSEEPSGAPDPMIFRRIAKPCTPQTLWASLDAALEHRARQDVAAPPAGAGEPS